MLDGLGQVWLTDTLAYKEHPGCAYLQAAVEGVLRLREENGFEAADVARVDVRAGWLTLAMEKLAAGEPLTAVRVNFSVALSTAVALTAGRLTHEELTDAFLTERGDELRDLATRVFVTHDWDQTAKTLQGAGTGRSDVPLRRLAGVRRRMQKTGMDGFGIGLSDLREGARRIGLREIVRGRGVTPPEGRGVTPPDGGQIRMTFPCHVTIRLRSGGILETDGRERGGSGASLAEQEQVVSAKFDTVRGTADMPRAWRRRATPAAS
jgi:hypothetical protein